MKLKKVSVAGYKSIKHEITLAVDLRVTVLIGANDHGKTNILSAMEHLNDEKQLTLDDLNWDLHPQTEKLAIKWHFELSPSELEVLASIAAQAHAADPSAPIDELPINVESEVVLSRDLKTNSVQVVSTPLPVPRSNEKDVLALRPRIELFVAPNLNVRDQVTLAQLTTPEFEFMQGIFRHAGLWDHRDEIFVQTPRTSKKLDEASERLTAVLNSKWNQGRDLRWKLTHTGSNGDHIVIEISDPAIEAQYTRPSLRSSGFRTYFLLSMITYARTENRPENSYIYLFDEPGTYLHPHAQLDLQRSFEAIASRTQIVFTTHSMFLVNKNQPGRNRVVSKSKAGTMIDQKPFIKNWKAVRESLGILMSNNFLIAEKTLLVEGPSDVIYVLNAIKHLKSEGRIDIDLNDLSIVDAGSSQNYVAMAKLMVAEGREVVAMIDGDDGGKNLAKQLRKVCASEIANKKLVEHMLSDGHSSEDIFVDLKILRSAAQSVAEDLVSLGVRKLKDGVDLSELAKQITQGGGKTLGKLMNAQTVTWFETPEAISKLSIALKYEDIAKLGAQVPDLAASAITKIAQLLSLKREASDEKTIFDEV